MDFETHHIHALVRLQQIQIATTQMSLITTREDWTKLIDYHLFGELTISHSQLETCRIVTNSITEEYDLYNRQGDYEHHYAMGGKKKKFYLVAFCLKFPKSVFISLSLSLSDSLQLLFTFFDKFTFPSLNIAVRWT